MLSGCLAGMFYWGIPYPADAIKSKIQTGTHGIIVEGGGTPSIRAVARHTFKMEGIKGFYKGCGITVLRAGPGNGATHTRDRRRDRQRQRQRQRDRHQTQRDRHRDTERRRALLLLEPRV